jgi:hypothetical protein
MIEIIQSSEREIYKTVHRVGLNISLNNCSIGICNMYGISILKYGNIHFTLKDMIEIS